jgi:hypothetical protein
MICHEDLLFGKFGSNAFANTILSFAKKFPDKMSFSRPNRTGNSAKSSNLSKMAELTITVRVTMAQIDGGRHDSALRRSVDYKLVMIDDGSDGSASVVRCCRIPVTFMQIGSEHTHRVLLQSCVGAQPVALSRPPC